MAAESQAPASDANLSSAAVWQALGELGRQLSALAQAVQGQVSATGASLPLTPPALEGVTLTDAVNQLLVGKARTGRGDRYLRQLRCSLAAFCRGRGRRELAAIGADEIERWLLARNVAARTKANSLRDLRLLFAWAQRRGYVARNPALAVELPESRNTAAPGIHTPDQVRRVLEVARERDPQVCRLLAVRYFAGVRSAEAMRLREADL